MVRNQRKQTIKERWEQWVVIIVFTLTGAALIFASLSNNGIVQLILLAIGSNLLSSALVTFFILLLVGSDVGGLKSQIDHLGQEVNKLHEVIENETDAMYKNIGKLSTLVADAYNLGIVGLGRSRYSPTLEGNKNFVERWKHLLENAQEVDVICFADRMLFYYDIFDRFFIEKIQKRMSQESENALKLRIILSSEENPYNKEINEWANDPDYMESRIHNAKLVLTRLCGGTLDPKIVKEHKSFVPFTLLRGDSHMYVMFFMPGHAGGPVLEIRPIEMIAFPKIPNLEDDQKLFQIYQSYFEDMWEKYDQP